MSNKFADALKPSTREPERAARSPAGNSRDGRKHVGGYFDPAVSRRLRLLATEEDTTVQELLGEAIALLFQSRGV